MPADLSRGVFLSYASEDAAAARRIAAALREAGVEVWFDQNELVGGDAWDAKIRGQIAACALFVPVISAATQARLEGYFRVEWKLAARRTHAMATAKAFLLPVVIDDTSDAMAHVPDEFREVQWTRLRNGDTSAAFCARVQTLLGGSAPEPGRARPGGRDEGVASPRTTSSLPRFGRPRTILAVVGFAALAVLIWQPWKTRAPASGVTTAATAPISEANRLVAKAWEQMDKTEMARSELLLAEGFCRQAAALEETNPAVWAAWSAMNTWYLFHGFDLLPARKEAAREYAQKALALDPKSYEARYAWAHFVVRLSSNIGEERPALPILRELLSERPDEPRALYALGFGLMYDAANADEGFALLDRLAEKYPSFAGRALNEAGWMALFKGRYALAESAAERALKAHSYWNNLGLKATLALRLRGDVELAQATIDRLPPSALQENWGIALAVMVADWRGDHSRAVSILQGVPRDWLENFFYVGPTSFLTGQMRLKAKQVTAAEKDFRRALELIAPRLEKTPNDPYLLYYRAEAQRLLGMREDADRSYRQVREVWPDTFAPLTFEPPEPALEYVRRMVKRGHTIEYFPAGWWFTAASLRLDPVFENVRRAPGFRALLDEVEQREKQLWSQTPAAAGAKITAASSEKPEAPEKSIAVLAFANTGGDKDNEIFSDGISDELLNVLAKIPGLKVSARTSAFFFKGKQVPIAEVARQLGVAYVVEGSVRKAGDKVRITAQLIKAADGFHVWGDTFTRELKDIFAVQDEIAGLIAKSLELTLAGRAGPAREIAPEAYQHYLSGRAAVAKAGMADLRQAVTHFERAVAKEPTFADAWVQLAAANTQLGRWGGRPTHEAWPAARTAIDRARQLDPESPDAWLALGWILRTADWDWRGAERAFRRALALRPNHPDTLSAASVFLFNIGQQEEAFQLGRQAAKLDPLNPATQIDLSLMFFFSENWAEAEQAARRALQLSSTGAGYHAILAWSLVAQKRFAEAEAEAMRDHSEVERLNGLGMLALARGQTSAAREHLAKLESLARIDPNRVDLQQSIAWMCAGLGEIDRAFAALEKAAGSRDPSVAWSRTMWPLRKLYGDPRWPEFLRKVGLADEQLK